MRPDLQRPPAVPDTLTPGDQLVAAGLGVGAAASGLVWATGQLAGLAFGHSWLELDPADVARVVLQLRHHLDDPALAWPTAAQQALPGPVGMYASFVATTAGAVGAAGGAMRLWQRAGLGNPNAPGARTKRPAAGSATWATPRELRPLRARRPEPGRVILGRTSRAFGQLLAAEDCHSVLVFGPPGSFKTAGVVIPAILEWAGPVLATSVKPDVIKATRAHRERRGEVVVLDPLGSSGLAGARWTPLASCRSWAGAQQMAATIAHTADLGTLGTAEHKYWKTLGQKLLAPLLFAAASDDRTMAEVLRWVDLREDSEVAKLLEDAGVDGAITAWEASQSRTDKARDSVYGTAEDLLAIYTDERVQRFTAGHDLAEQDFLTGDHTLYLYAPVHEQRRLRPLFETVAMQLVQTAQEQAARAPDGMLDPRLLCALDEAGNVAALELLPEWATTGRGQGIQLLSVWHDQAQLVHRYGDRAATILNGHRAKVFLSGLADVGALELGSRLIGDQAVTETNYSTDPGGRVAASQATSYRPLVPVEELRRLQPGEGIVIYGHLRPARIQVRPHFSGREQRWRQRLERHAARQQERNARKANRALERAAQRDARRQDRVNRRLPDWARGREGPAVTADPTPTPPQASDPSSGRHPLGTVYLFHFDQRYEHAGHYTGWAEDLDHRVAEHLAGRGARLIEVITQAGISFRLARTWPGVTRARERQLKRQGGGASRHCPICQDDRKARGLPRRPSRDRDHGQGDQRPNRGQGHQQWAPAVPTRGTRPDRVRAFLELNPGFARPARASQAKQWGGARSREEVELLGPRVTSATWDENLQPSQHRVATVTRRAVQARLQARQERTAHSAEQTRSRDLAARTHQRLLAHQRRQAAAGAGTAPERSATVNAELARLLREGRWVQPTSATGVLGIGAAAFLLSYDALHSLALASGVRPGLARIWPGVLDGFIVVATLTVVAAKRASRPTWYPWALVVLFSAASVAFNILHAVDRTLAAAGWVAALVFATPPVALVLATHLLLQQGVWRRQHARAAPAAGMGSERGASQAAVARTRPAAGSPGQPELALAGVGVTGRPSTPPVSPPSAPGDPATRDRARRLYVEAQAAGRKLTGADLGRALGTSDSYGRLLLREFRTSHPALGNGTARGEA